MHGLALRHAYRSTGAGRGVVTSAAAPRAAGRCCAAGPRAARLADLPRILHTFARKLIAGALALVAIAALAWRGCASRSRTGHEDRDEDRDGDRDNDGDGDAELERIREQVRGHRPPPPPGRWVDVVAPAFAIPPHASDAYCFVTHLPNVETLAIRRWRSRMSGAIRDIAVFLGPAAATQAPEVRRAPCDRLVAPPASEALAYISHTLTGELELPPNDGAGHPVAQFAEPGALLVVEMQIVNPTERELPAQLELHMEAVRSGIVATPLSSVIAFHHDLRIPAGTAAAPGAVTVTGSCAVPADLKLFGVSTYTHHRGTRAFVKDGSHPLLENTTWDRPDTQAWWTGYALNNAQFEYGCEYRNPTPQPVTLGGLPDAELCVIVGYVYPARQPIRCPN
jgi:hypothetical protein